MSVGGEVVASEQETCRVSCCPAAAPSRIRQDWWEAHRPRLGAAAGQRRRRAGLRRGGQLHRAVVGHRAGRRRRPPGAERDHLDGLARRAAGRRDHRRPGPGAGLRASTSWSRWIRTTAGLPSRSGKDSDRAHPVAQGAASRRRTERTKLFLEPKDWLNLRLTGRAVATYDSIALHWVTDNHEMPTRSLRPGPAAAGRAGRGQLPDLVAATDIVGPLLPGPAAALGVPGRNPSRRRHARPAVGGDRVGATRDFQAHLYIGTSSWLTCHVPFKKTDLLRNIASLPAAIRGRYFVADEQETAGAALTFLRDRVLFPAGDAPADAYREFDGMAADIAAGQPRRDLHAVALRRAEPGRGQLGRAAGSTTCRSRPPARTWCVRCSRAWRSTRAGCWAQWSGSRDDGSTRSGSSAAARVRRVVPDLRRRARPDDRAGRRPRQRQRSGCRDAGCGGAGRDGLRRGARPGPASRADTRLTAAASAVYGRVVRRVRRALQAEQKGARAAEPLSSQRPSALPVQRCPFGRARQAAASCN